MSDSLLISFDQNQTNSSFLSDVTIDTNMTSAQTADVAQQSSKDPNAAFLQTINDTSLCNSETKNIIRDFLQTSSSNKVANGGQDTTLIPHAAMLRSYNDDNDDSWYDDNDYNNDDYSYNNSSSSDWYDGWNTDSSTNDNNSYNTNNNDSNYNYNNNNYNNGYYDGNGYYDSNGLYHNGYYDDDYYYHDHHNHSSNNQSSQNNNAFSLNDRNAIIQMGTNASGVDLSQPQYSQWVGWQQDALSNGKSLDDLRNQFVHEGFVTQQIIQMGTNASGVDLSQPQYSQWVGWQQDALSNGKSLDDLRNQFVHEGFVTQQIIQMGTNASGVDLSQPQYSQWVGWQQDALSNGKSLDDLRNQFVHEGFVTQQIIQMGTNASGVDLSQPQYSQWVGWQQDALSNGKSLDDLRNQFVHEGFVTQQIIQMGTNASGVDLSQPQYSQWVGWQQDALSNGKSLDDLRNQFVHEGFVTQQIIQMGTNASGVDLSQPQYSQWVGWQQDALSNGKSLDDLRNQFIHEGFVTQQIIQMGTNASGVDLSQPQYSQWVTEQQNFLSQGGNFEQIDGNTIHQNVSVTNNTNSIENNNIKTPTFNIDTITGITPITPTNPLVSLKPLTRY